MSRRTIYTLFVLKFVFSLTLIFWTIKMTMGAGVGDDNDNTFLSTYSKIDDSFNEINNKNQIFNTKYETIITINNTQIKSMSYQDIFLSQRVIKKRTINKNILNFDTNNSIKVVIKDINSNKIIKDINASIIFTRPNTHDDDLKLSIDQSNKLEKFTINKKAYWNIMGSVNINDDEGHFYIKTNSK